MAGEGLQEGGVLRPLLEHLRGSLDEVIFQITGRPFRVSSKNSMEQMPVFVKESNHVVPFHQARTVRGLRKVADQHVLWHAKPFLASGQAERGIVLILVFPREHIK